MFVRDDACLSTERKIFLAIFFTELYTHTHTHTRTHTHTHAHTHTHTRTHTHTHLDINCKTLNYSPDPRQIGIAASAGLLAVRQN